MNLKRLLVIGVGAGAGVVGGNMAYGALKDKLPKNEKAQKGAEVAFQAVGAVVAIALLDSFV